MAENDKVQELEKIPKPIYADFIIENANGVLTQSGTYYHFGDVISILKAWDMKKPGREQDELLPYVVNMACGRCKNTLSPNLKNGECIICNAKV